MALALTNAHQMASKAFASGELAIMAAVGCPHSLDRVLWFPLRTVIAAVGAQKEPIPWCAILAFLKLARLGYDIHGQAITSLQE
jgi:hypothetical protein